MVDTYRVRVRGHLDDRWSARLGGLAVQRLSDGTTLLVGPIRDQAALFGVIAGIRDLGLALLSVTRDAEGAGPDAPGCTPARPGRRSERPPTCDEDEPVIREEDRGVPQCD